MYEAVLIPEARAERDALSGLELTQVNLIIRLLELDPWGDNETKFTARMGDWTAGVYDGGRWELTYRIIDGRFIEIVGISRISS